jgi:hypothetical protein
MGCTGLSQDLGRWRILSHTDQRTKVKMNWSQHLPNIATKIVAPVAGVSKVAVALATRGLGAGRRQHSRGDDVTALSESAKGPERV